MCQNSVLLDLNHTTSFTHYISIFCHRRCWSSKAAFDQFSFRSSVRPVSPSHPRGSTSLHLCPPFLLREKPSHTFRRGVFLCSAAVHIWDKEHHLVIFKILIVRSSLMCWRFFLEHNYLMHHINFLGCFHTCSLVHVVWISGWIMTHSHFFFGLVWYHRLNFKETKCINNSHVGAVILFTGQKLRRLYPSLSAVH